MAKQAERRAATSEAILTAARRLFGTQGFAATTMDEIAAKHFGGKLPRAIATAMDAGLIARQPVEPLARLLLGAVTEAAVACAGRADIARAGAEYARAFKSLVEALRLTE